VLKWLYCFVVLVVSCVGQFWRCRVVSDYLPAFIVCIKCPSCTNQLFLTELHPVHQTMPWSVGECNGGKLKTMYCMYLCMILTWFVSCRWERESFISVSIGRMRNERGGGFIQSGFLWMQYQCWMFHSILSMQQSCSWWCWAFWCSPLCWPMEAAVILLASTSFNSANYTCNLT